MFGPGGADSEIQSEQAGSRLPAVFSGVELMHSNPVKKNIYIFIRSIDLLRAFDLYINSRVENEKQICVYFLFIISCYQIIMTCPYVLILFFSL